MAAITKQLSLPTLELDATSPAGQVGSHENPLYKFFSITFKDLDVEKKLSRPMGS